MLNCGFFNNIFKTVNYDFKKFENKKYVNDTNKKYYIKVKKAFNNKELQINKIQGVKMFNAYVISEMDAENIEKKLQGTWLEGMGNTLYDIEQNKGINFRAIYAIGALESGHGKYTANTYNYFGIKNGNGKGYRAFNSKSESLYYVANLLNHSIYKDKSLDDIGKIYCPPDKEWSYKVRQIMNEI